MLDYQQPMGTNALLLAIENESLPYAMMLIDIGSNVEHSDEVSCQHWVCECGDLILMHILTVWRDSIDKSRKER